MVVQYTDSLSRLFMEVVDANIERDRKECVVIEAEIKAKGGYRWAAYEILDLRRELAAARRQR